uniref:Uncharacterized protein n=1 Tax=Rangifer tarandus platyrhynchus TaxID=3082113 RepID=A0ACB0E2K5_RANTA|nr:unnamed protein product [Rangifer tarandus platyrhynchus]
MEVASGPAAPETREIWALKQCLLSHSTSWEKHGMVASCLKELRNKACDILAIDKSLAPVTLVLAKDGTTMQGQLGLPKSPSTEMEQIGAGLKWNNVARQRREDLSSIILLSEEVLQMLIDVLCSELAQKLGQSHVAVQGFQSTLQQGLDQREEACQSRQLLELYLQALKKEGSIVSKQQESRADLGDERDAVDTSVRESSSKVMPASQILVVLKEKSAPE